jgi:hypothetical protein
MRSICRAAALAALASMLALGGAVAAPASGGSMDTNGSIQATILEGVQHVRQGTLEMSADQRTQGMAAAPGLIDAAGLACQVADARLLGVTVDAPTKVKHAVYEIACAGSEGYVIATTADAKPLAFTCLEAGAPRSDGKPSNTKCILPGNTDPLAGLARLIAHVPGGCTAEQVGPLGHTPDDSLFEVSCHGGAGWVIESTTRGVFSRAIDCARADDEIAGGCKLTDSHKAKAAQATRYSRSARASGFTCDVSDYAPLPTDAHGDEVVELACANRPDGGVGVFVDGPRDASVVYDCAYAELKGYRCNLTKAAAAYARLTDDLKLLGKTSCTVSNARPVGVSERYGYIEVACADGLQGYLVEYALAPLAPSAAIVCSSARKIGGGCALPCNTAKS